VLGSGTTKSQFINQLSAAQFHPSFPGQTLQIQLKEYCWNLFAACCTADIFVKVCQMNKTPKRKREPNKRELHNKKQQQKGFYFHRNTIGGW
jgi:hypothetical protein